MSDSVARIKALDPQLSFIVQAPAGSGKTELLTQRFLALLKVVKAPEEILAVTFTNKAAAQMKARIMMRLRAEPSVDKWDILKNPNRLRVVTIDAFCGYLSARLPLLSNFGCQPDIIDAPRILFQAAAEALLKTLESNMPWSKSLQAVLAHLDNRYDLAIHFFIKLLEKRDQWLDLIHSVDSDLNVALTRIIEHTLKQVAVKINDDQSEIALQLMQHAYQHVPEDSILKKFPYPDYFPTTQAHDLARWQALSYFLTTQEGGFRKRVDKNLGFIAKRHQTEKDNMMHLLSELSAQYEADAFSAIQSLPDLDYSPSQISILKDLKIILPALVAQLKVIFKLRGQVDFIEVAEGASRALGELDDPSDLALSLDYQIQHILIDEFQDTSVSQFRLFERLVAGWSLGDGRTLFLVGDPMQSIYHFRGAEVGLFIRARQYGLGDIELIPLYLTQNFRSHPVLVEHYNKLFVNIFPREDDLSLGAVKFHAAEAALQSDAAQALHVLSIQGAKSVETRCLINTIKSIQVEHPDYKIGILSRTKQQLNDLLNELKNHNLAFQAEQLEPLSSQSLILDLNALTMALLNKNDRIAWFSILRAPWCGLTLQDLYYIKQNEQETIWAALNDTICFNRISLDGQCRLNRIILILNEWFSQKGRVSLRHWVEGLWLRLGGPACLNDLKEKAMANAFFELLESMDEGCTIKDKALWDEKIASLYLENQASESDRANLSLMTIHKAKGLEFDVVMLVGMEDAPAIDDPQLLLWFERPWEEGVDLLFAPKAELGDSDKLYDYIRQHIKAKKNLEYVRLLYVAMTRARKKLFLCARFERADQKPTKGSFVYYLKFLFAAQQSFSLTENEVSVLAECKVQAPPLKRLSSNWRFPIILKKPDVPEGDDLNHPEGLGQSLGYLAYHRHVGVLVHQIFQLIAEQGYEKWQTYDLNPLRKSWEIALQQMGVHSTLLIASLNLVNTAVQNLLSDHQVAWIFSSKNTAVKNEWALCDLNYERVQTHILDRAWIDSKGNRWILDYKIVDNSSECFDLNKEIHKYLPQLKRYGKLLRGLEKKPIWGALYFPLEKIWWETAL